jgi:hypothetical protein
MQRTHYDRAWSLFMEDYPLVPTPFLLQPFFPPGQDAKGTEGVSQALGQVQRSFVMNFKGLPAGNLPPCRAELSPGPQPVGVQIAGRRWREDLIVGAMQATEERLAPAWPRGSRWLSNPTVKPFRKKMRGILRPAPAHLSSEQKCGFSRSSTLAAPRTGRKKPRSNSGAGKAFGGDIVRRCGAEGLTPAQHLPQDERESCPLNRARGRVQADFPEPCPP